MSAATAAPHRWSVRVYYEDTDASGLVYHAAYLRFAERARTELLRALGLDHRGVAERSGLRFAVRRVEAEFLAPAFLDDLLVVESRPAAWSGARLTLAQTLLCGERTLCRLLVTLVLLDRRLRPARLDRALPEAFLGLLPRLREPR